MITSVANGSGPEPFAVRAGHDPVERPLTVLVRLGLARRGQRPADRVVAAAGDEEIRAFAEAQKQGMPDDGLVQTTPEAPFQSLAASVSGIAMTVAGLDWTVLTSDQEFIANDRGLAMWDPHLPESRGNMWASSPAAETTVPIAPNVCLRLTPGGSGYGDPFARDPQRVLDDVVSGYVSLEAAEHEYGVVVRYTGAPDQLVRLPGHYTIDWDVTNQR